ncbi:hypothetical protein ES703_34841 [subsurface metagenome]
MWMPREKASREMPISPALVAMSRMEPARMAISGLSTSDIRVMGIWAAMPATGSRAHSEASSWGVIAESDTREMPAKITSTATIIMTSARGTFFSGFRVSSAIWDMVSMPV